MDGYHGYHGEHGDERLRELRLRAQAQALHLERTIGELRPGVPDAVERRAAEAIVEARETLAGDAAEPAVSRAVARIEEVLGLLPAAAGAPGAEYAAPIER